MTTRRSANLVVHDEVKRGNPENTAPQASPYCGGEAPAIMPEFFTSATGAPSERPAGFPSAQPGSASEISAGHASRSAGRASGARQPRATLRLQLHAGYTFDDARADLPYFERLGVSHLYLSPVSRARRGSTHGYDVVDHGRVDPSRGGEAALRRLGAAAAGRGMGMLLDIVPNHMATDPENAWWWDVLAHGRHSAWAHWFDIDWDAPALPGKVLAPFLGSPYAQALREGEIRLRYDPALGFHVQACGAPYPLAPGSLLMPDSLLAPASLSLHGGRADTGAARSDAACPGLSDAPEARDAVLAAHDPASAEGRRRLHDLLERQHYRLETWRSAARRINWRRFFEESGLIGVRVECDEVFEAVHALPLRLYAEGVIDGLRIDHVDGLARPLAYCARLKAAMRAAGKRRPAGDGAAEPWIVVEKILAPGEVLDERWVVSGTTGYDFAADVGALQHDADGEAALFEGWSQVAGDARPPQAWLIDARRALLARHFGAERNALLDVLARLGRHGPPGWTRAAIGRALDAVLVHYPTYRGYVEAGLRHPADQAWFDQALRGARAGGGSGAPVAAALPAGEASARELSAGEAAAGEMSEVGDALLSQLDGWLGRVAPASEEAIEAVRRFQQLTPPLAAKSMEDTLFYRYGCLLSRNEVGSDPAVFACGVEAFHLSNDRRARAMPRGLLATATHDHKRGEDVRARLAVVSETPQHWLDACREWLGFAQTGIPEGGAPLAFRYMLLQTLMGAWPPQLSADDAKGVADYLERVAGWAIKALREGKQLSSWFAPDLECERACEKYLRSLAPGQSRHAVLTGIERYVRGIEPAAIANGLIQAALRMTCPGVPDLYQGTEYRDFSLVDPDNRRPVDFRERARTLAEAGYSGAGAPARPVFDADRWPAAAWTDGRVKQALVAALLALRREYADAFSGGYRPLTPRGGAASRLVAFARSDQVVVLAGVKCAAALRAGPAGMPVAQPRHWSDAAVSLPGGPGVWRDVLRGRRIHCGAAPQRLAGLLEGFPLAVLCRDQG